MTTFHQEPQSPGADLNKPTPEAQLSFLYNTEDQRDLNLAMELKIMFKQAFIYGAVNRPNNVVNAATRATIRLKQGLYPNQKPLFDQYSHLITLAAEDGEAMYQSIADDYNSALLAKVRERMGGNPNKRINPHAIELEYDWSSVKLPFYVDRQDLARAFAEDLHNHVDNAIIVIRNSMLR